LPSSVLFVICTPAVPPVMHTPIDLGPKHVQQIRFKRTATEWNRAGNLPLLCKPIGQINRCSIHRVEELYLIWVALTCYSTLHRCLKHIHWGIKNCTLLIGTITLQNYAIIW